MIRHDWVPEDEKPTEEDLRWQKLDKYDELGEEAFRRHCIALKALTSKSKQAKYKKALKKAIDKGYALHSSVLVTVKDKDGNIIDQHVEEYDYVEDFG